MKVKMQALLIYLGIPMFIVYFFINLMASCQLDCRFTIEYFFPFLQCH